MHLLIQLTVNDGNGSNMQEESLLNRESILHKSKINELNKHKKVLKNIKESYRPRVRVAK